MLTRAFLLSLLVASPLAAQGSRPDFTGTWVLDPTKTVVDGPLAGPSAGTYVVTQTGDSIAVDQRVTTEVGELALKKVWKVDGKAWTNYMSYGGTDLTLSSVLKWDGAVLAIRTSTDFGGTPVVQDQTWTLSADGKTLTDVTTTNVNGSYYASVTSVFSKK